MPISGIVYRHSNPAGPLTSAQGDNNLKLLADGFNSLEARMGVVLNTNGTLKPGAVSSSNVITDGVVTLAKLAPDARVPAGMIMAFAGTVAPPGWLECNGQGVSRSGETAALFAAIGDMWGAGDGSTTFLLPNLNGRALIGRNGNLVYYNDGASPPNPVIRNTVGSLGGQDTHLLTGEESGIQKHHHFSWVNAVKFGPGTVMGSGNNAQEGTFMTEDVADTPAVRGHPNIQNSAVIMWCIKK